MYSLFLVALNDNILNSRVINYIYIYIYIYIYKSSKT